MLILHEREKLIQIIIFLAKNTLYCGKTKLFKLLYFLDFEHYMQTGRSVTGLEYSAWKMGPVPTALADEIESPEPDMAEALMFAEVPTNYGRPMLSIKPIKDFNDELFSKREKKLLEMLEQEYKNSKAEDMIEATHLENMPWDRVYNQEHSPMGLIPYAYALKANESEEMLKIIDERKEMIKAIG
ncbi:MAG: Panacea domain-containing protein [Methyloglobulus sp.]|nr:SocA family protein [Methyloglobulus sp.]